MPCNLLAFNRPVSIAGDSNVHVNDNPDTLATSYLDICSKCGLLERMQKRTHRKGHRLDLALTSDFCIMDQIVCLIVPVYYYYFLDFLQLMTIKWSPFSL